MSQIRVCFLGTPDFAAQHLQALINDEHYEVVCVVTQPDRPQGRNLKLSASPVKELALKNNIQVYTPENLKKDLDCVDKILIHKAEIAVVVAFGQILSESFIQSFTFGAVNIHGSLLPLWRGAAPIQRSIENGDSVTGVTLQKVVKKLDAGPVIGLRKLILDNEINATEVYSKLAKLGCELLHVEMMDFIRGHLAAIPQDETQVTFASKIDKSESQIFFTEAALKIHNKVRAFSMGPGVFFEFKDATNLKRLKIHKTQVIKTQNQNENQTFKPGQIINVSSNDLIVQTSQDQIALLVVQPESKPRLAIDQFLKTQNLKIGDFINECLR